MVYDPHGSIYMNEIAISKFKATCLEVLERVRKTRQPVRVTRFGKPVADIVPPQDQPPRIRRLGTGVGSGRILGDIVGPIGDETDWDAARDPGADEQDK
jgi:prevent-host-death family protein